MNALRLNRGFRLAEVEARTGLSADTLTAPLNTLCRQELMVRDNEWIHCSALGQRYLNDVVGHFLH